MAKAVIESHYLRKLAQGDEISTDANVRKRTVLFEALPKPTLLNNFDPIDPILYE